MPLSRETIITLGNKLAPSASTFSRLRALLLDPDTELEEITKLIRLDPGPLRKQLGGRGGGHGVFPEPARLEAVGDKVPLANLLRGGEADETEDFAEPDTADGDVE